MTEAEWLACGDPTGMLFFLFGGPDGERRAYCQGEVGRRKLRLFACACLYRVWHLLPDGRSRAAVELADRYAEVAAEWSQVPAARRDADEATRAADYAARDAAGEAVAEAAVAAARALDPDGWYAARGSAYYARRAVALSAGDAAAGREAVQQCRLLRCVVSSPFHPPAPPAVDWLRWGGRTVLKLARAIYDEGRFEEVPVLADALEDAGCADAALLAHLREPGPHARGCWPVDLVLGLATAPPPDAAARPAAPA
jgi:hypothetical protein